MRRETSFVGQIPTSYAFWLLETSGQVMKYQKIHNSLIRYRCPFCMEEIRFSWIFRLNVLIYTHLHIQNSQEIWFHFIINPLVRLIRNLKWIIHEKPCFSIKNDSFITAWNIWNVVSENSQNQNEPYFELYSSVQSMKS